MTLCLAATFAQHHGTSAAPQAAGRLAQEFATGLDAM